MTHRTRLKASVERHVLTSLAARYGYRSDVTFYTQHGDVFAYLCAVITLSIIAAMQWVSLRRRANTPQTN